MDAHREAADFERFLAHSGWLTALARRLASDPATADDLVQDTWHAALRARAGTVRSDRGWLSTLLANLARARARSENARRLRERAVAASESVEGPDRLVERAEAQRNLLARVLELDEPYRSTVLERYVEGRTSAEIAHLRGVNESTVRTRLARAHARLRERIERDGGGLLALAPLVDGAHSANAAAVSGAAKATAGALGIGAGIMGLTLKTGAVAAVVLCAWLAWRAFEPPDAPVALAPPVVERSGNSDLDATRGPATPRVAEIAPEPASSAPEIAAAPTQPAVAAVVRSTLDITVLRDGIPAPGIHVWIAPEKDWPMLECLDVKARPPEGARTLDSDRAGVAAFTDLDRSVWRYTAGFGTAAGTTRPTRFATAVMYAGHAYMIRIGSGIVHGHVYDDLGRDRAGVGVQVYSAGYDQSHFLIAAHTVVDERGEYSIGDLAAGRYHVSMEADGRFDGFGEVSRTDVELGEGEDKAVDFGSSTPGWKWTGRVLNAFGEHFLGTGALELSNDRDARTLAVPINAEGRFDLAFRPGTWSVRATVAGAPAGGFDLGHVELPNRNVERDLIVPGTRLRVHLVEPTGLVEDRKISIRPKGHDYPAAFRDAWPGADGAHKIDGLVPGEWTISVYPGSFEEGSAVDVTIGPQQDVVDVHLHWASR